MTTKEIDLPCQHCGLPNRYEITPKPINGKCHECGHSIHEHDKNGVCSQSDCYCGANNKDVS